MAQLDRFLNLLITNNASVLSLSEGEIATLTIKDVPRPVMKQALTSAQILTLVREITELHGGKVSVVSKVNAGSTFTLRIPIADVEGTEKTTLQR